MLSVKWGFAVIVAALIAVGVAVPAHAITVKVFDSGGVQCGSTVTGTSSASLSVTCDSVAVSGTIAAVTNGTTRQFSVTNFVANNNALTAMKTVRINATHNFAGAVSTAGIGWTGAFKRGTLVTTVAKSSFTSFEGSVTCLPNNSVTTLSTASYTVPSTATSYTANSFAKGTTKTPVPTNCSSQTLTGNINVTLQGASNIDDSLSAHSSADLFLGDQVPVKLAVVSAFVNAQVHPTIDVNPTSSGKVLVVLFCKKDFDEGADPDQEKWSLPDPFGTIDPAQTTFGGAHVVGKVGKADMDQNGCVDAKMQFEVAESGIQCGDTSATFHTVVELCIEETVTTGRGSHQTTTTQTTCQPQEVQVEVPIDTSQWC